MGKKRRLVKIKKMKMPGMTSRGPCVKAHACNGRKQSRSFLMRVDTGADTSIIPASAVNEIGINLYNEPKNVLLANGKFEDVKTISCGIKIDGIDEIFHPVEGISVIDKEFGFLGLDILDQFIMVLEGGNGILAKAEEVKSFGGKYYDYGRKETAKA